MHFKSCQNNISLPCSGGEFYIDDIGSVCILSNAQIYGSMQSSDIRRQNQASNSLMNIYQTYIKG